MRARIAHLLTASPHPARRGVALAWTAAILALCLPPASWLGIVEVVPTGEGLPLPPPDKVVHFTLFAGFSVLWSAAAWPARRPAMVLAAGLALAVITELWQELPFIARDGNLADGLADSAGALAGVLAAPWLLRRDEPTTVRPHVARLDADEEHQGVRSERPA